MSSALERLKKILKLERQQGYRNKSVIGGFERLSERWQGDATKEAVSAGQRALVRAIVEALRGYRSLQEVEARQRAVDHMLALAGRWEKAAEEHEAATVAEEATAAQAPRPAAKAPPRSATAARQPEQPKATAATAKPAKPTRKPAAPPGPRPTPVGAASLRASVSKLPGVGPAYTERLRQLDVHTIGDLLWLLPRRYLDYNNLKLLHQLRAGETASFVANLWKLRSKRLPGRNTTLVTGLVGDSTATLEVTWFNPYVYKQLRVGQAYVFSGKVESYRGRLVMRNPEWEPLDRERIHTSRLVPVYPLTKGISAKWMRNLQWRVVNNWGKQIHDYLPESVRERAGLMPLGQALEQVHFPSDYEHLEQAKRRLAFDELFLIQIGVLRQRRQWKAASAQPLPLSSEAREAFLQALPFRFTAAQERAAAAILQDMAQPQPMSRLLQGDVGSGKTAVAALAIWATTVNGVQAALMVPTEILAEQHYRSLGQLFANLRWHGQPVRIALLTGRQRSSERVTTLEGLASGQIDLVVGTHALIQQGVEFRHLGLVIIDEQHRFGVRQRAMLRRKGDANDGSKPRVPHLLVMSATPIPRTLSLTLFGDLDLSVIDEMPPGRRPIKTRWLLPRERERAYAFIRRQVEAGHQGFIIYPLVEASDSVSAGAAIPQYERLCKEIFPDLRLGLLHGRMKSEEKDAVMRAMQRGDIDILVATPVIEVGIDIPNATVIMIEDAERFGLAQLHQFRGRVGRSDHPSYCILISSGTSPNAVERLQAVEESQDGFALAEKDLQLRGPGDWFGVRQSGLPELKLAQLSDLATLELARTEAIRLLEEDPNLERPEHQALARKARRFWQGEGDIS